MELLPDKSLLPSLNLDVELFERNNVSIAFLVIISGLIKNVDQRKDILKNITPNKINVPFDRFLFQTVSDSIRGDNAVDITSIIEHIPTFGPSVYGELSNERSLRGHYFTLAQILGFQPTTHQIEKAIDMVVGLRAA